MLAVAVFCSLLSGEHPAAATSANYAETVAGSIVTTASKPVLTSPASQPVAYQTPITVSTTVTVPTVGPRPTLLATMV